MYPSFPVIRRGVRCTATLLLFGIKSATALSSTAPEHPAEAAADPPAITATSTAPAAAPTPAAVRPTLEITDPSLAGAIPLTHRPGRHLQIPVSIGSGPPHLFVIDSGSPINVIDPARIDTTGLPEAPGGGMMMMMAGGQKPRMLGPVDLNLPGAVAHQQRLLAADLSILDHADGSHVEGILGLPFLALCTVVIDEQAKRVELSLEPHQPTAPGALELLLSVERGIPAFQARIGNRLDGLLGLDTGNPYGLILNPDARSALPGLGKEASVAIAGTEFTAVPVDTLPRPMPLPGNGILGLKFLTGRRLILDFPNDRAWLEPFAQAAHPAGAR